MSNLWVKLRLPSVLVISIAILLATVACEDDGPSGGFTVTTSEGITDPIFDSGLTINSPVSGIGNRKLHQNDCRRHARGKCTELPAVLDGRIAICNRWEESGLVEPRGIKRPMRGTIGQRGYRAAATRCEPGLHRDKLVAPYMSVLSRSTVGTHRTLQLLQRAR
jgi:hypothetical protein